MRLTCSFIKASRFPQSPPLVNGCLFALNPPLGFRSLKGHKKLFTSLNLGPHVKI